MSIVLNMWVNTKYQVDVSLDGGQKYQTIYKDTDLANCWVIALAYRSVGFEFAEND